MNRNMEDVGQSAHASSITASASMTVMEAEVVSVVFRGGEGVQESLSKPPSTHTPCLHRFNPARSRRHSPSLQRPRNEGWDRRAEHTDLSEPAADTGGLWEVVAYEPERLEKIKESF